MRAIRGALVALALTAAVPAAGQEASRTVDVTIYGSDIAVVRDRRPVALEAGERTLRLGDVSPRLLPDSVVVRPPANVRVRGLRFAPGMPDRLALLRHFEGDEVLLVRTAGDAQEYVSSARLLSAEPLVVEVEGRVETDPAGRVAFPTVPPDLAGEAAITALVETAAPVEGETELLYLTDGLSWSADYVLTLAPGGERVDLDAFATLRNETGWAVPQARLTLAAGEINRARGEAPMMRAETMAAAPADAMPAERALLGMRFYEVPEAVALAEGEVRRVALLSARDVPAELGYRHRAPGYVFHPRGQEVETRAERLLTVRNQEAAGLGRALPGGVVRVYGQGGDGAPRLLGEDRAADVAPNRALEVLLGRDIDLPVRHVQTEFRQLSPRVQEAAYEVTLGNAKGHEVTVRVEHPFPGAWEVLSENLPHRREDAFTPAWDVPVPAGGEMTLAYRVRVRM